MGNSRNLANLLGTGSTIVTAKIADDAITTAKIASNAVTSSEVNSSVALTSDVQADASYFPHVVMSGSSELMDSGNMTADTLSGLANIGSGMSVSSGGKWTFPSTGIWRVSWNLTLKADGADAHLYTRLDLSTNNGSSYSSLRYGSQFHTAAIR